MESLVLFNEYKVIRITVGLMLWQSYPSLHSSLKLQVPSCLSDPLSLPLGSLKAAQIVVCSKVLSEPDLQTFCSHHDWEFPQKLGSSGTRHLISTVGGSAS